MRAFLLAPTQTVTGVRIGNDSIVYTSGGVTSYGVNKVNTLKQTLADVDKFRILNKDYLPLPAMDESNNGHSGDNKENDLYYKAYSDDVKRKMAVDVGVDGQSDKTSVVNASEKVETEEEFLERINKEAYTNRRWAVETPNLLSKEQYNDYLEIKKGKITGERVWQINDLITNEHLIRIDDWLILSKNNFADAPITALYKVSENHRQKIEEELYAAANEDRAIDREIIDYYVRKGAISEHKSENNQKDYTFDQREQNDNADYRPAGKQYDRTGDSGKSAEYEVGYKGESRYLYYNEDIGGYFVELVDGTKLRFYLPAKGSKDKRYSTGRAKYKTIKAMIKAENAKILRKSNKKD